MNYVKQTNNFFKQNIYNNLRDFALSPISWTTDVLFRNNPNINPKSSSLYLNYVLRPLVSATAISTAISCIIISLATTMAISLALAAVSALAHGLSLLVSAALDAAKPSTPEPAFNSI